MKTVRRYFYREVLTSVAFVALGFLALFLFFDFVDELRKINQFGRSAYGAPQAALYVFLSLPSRLYDLMPIAVLIGSIFVMARFAQTSEFTILRTSGLGPAMALRMLLTLGLVFTAFTFLVGDYLAPRTEEIAEHVKNPATTRITSGHTGAWLRERQGKESFYINIGALDRKVGLQSVRIFAYDQDGRAAAFTRAASARALPGEGWMLENVHRTLFVTDKDGFATVAEKQTLPAWRWKTEITEQMVQAAVLRPQDMSTLALYQYISHLNANDQSTQSYEIEFWRKVFYPLSCLVMVVLAIPFAYLHFRAGNMAGYMFGGVMAGISFFLLNNMFGAIGNLQNWSPWLAAATPGIIYSLLSFAAFGWLVLRR